jgi:HEAT repeat protein
MNFPAVLAVAILLPLCAGTEPAQEFQELVNQLRSEKADVRNDARRKLKEAGRSALPSLERAARDPDPEVASAAKELLRILPIAEKLSPALRAAFPGVEERLALGGDEAWTRAFLEAIGGDPNAPTAPRPDVGRADLEFLVGRAIRGADSGQASNICRALMKRPLRSAIPELAKLLRNPQCSQLAARDLSALPFPETLEAIVSLLKDQSEEARMRAAEALAGLHLPEAGPPLVALLSDPNDQVKNVAIHSLGTLGYRPAGPALRKCLRLESQPTLTLEALGKVGCKEAIGDIVPYLEAKNFLVRGYAAMALGELGAKETAPRIAKLLIPNPDDQEKYGISLALRALGQLGAKDALPLIRPYAGDPHVILRCRAICALAALEDRESAGLIVPALAEGDVGVSRGARHALRRLNASEQVPQILDLVKKDPDRGAEAIATLADLGARDAVPVLVPLLKRPMPYVRAFAAEALCRLGSDQGAQTLLEYRDVTPSLISLNALRQPQVWAKLAEVVFRENPEGRPVQIVESVARELGMKLDVSKPFLEDVVPNHWFGTMYMVVPFYWGQCRPLDVLDWIASLTGSELILESDRLRWVGREEARSFWKAWLEGRAKSGK